jgi:hypothetical protein
MPVVSPQNALIDSAHAARMALILTSDGPVCGYATSGSNHCASRHLQPRRTSALTGVD